MTVRKQTRRYARLVIAVGALAGAVLFPTSSAVAGSDDLSSARAGTAGYHDITTAGDAGYGLFTDAAGTACIANPGVGAMGVHYVNGGLVFNDAGVDAASPESLVYEPRADGRLALVAVEYVVLQSSWAEAGNTMPPSLFGQPFELVPSPNRYGLPPFYELHAWIWQYNANGMFDDWNPSVSCPAA